jgi:hypothetical protein
MKTATTTSTLRALAHAGSVPDPEIPESEDLSTDRGTAC